MSFQFSLRVLLRLKQSQEHQQRILLEQATKKVQQCKVRIADAEEQVRAVEREMQRCLLSGVRAAEMQFLSFRLLRVADYRQTLSAELTFHLQEQRKQLQTYQRLHRDREALDTLRLSQLRSFTVEEERRDQRRMDDFFLLRREYLRVARSKKSSVR